MAFFGEIMRSSSNTTNPARWLIDFFGGGSVSEAGNVVDADAMLSESAVWCALSFLASNIASLPCPVLKTTGRQRIKQRDHYLHQLLNVKANQEMTAMTWRETSIYYQALWGTSISIKQRDQLARIVALWPVHPDRLNKVKRVSGRLQYHILMGDPLDESGQYEIKIFDQDDILRVPGFGNGVLGLSMIEHSKNSMGLLLAMRSYANLFFKNGSNMGVIFEHPGKLGDTAHANLTKSLANSYSGLGRSHKAMVAEEGMTVKPVGVDPDKSQLLEGRQFSISDVARWFNLPPHVLKDLSHSNYSNMQQQSLELITYSFRPWFVKLEQSYEMFLLRDYERGEYSVRHNANALLRGDDQARGEYYKMRFATASITPNEIRGLEDENPIEEEWADKTYLQLNLVPADQLSEIQSEDEQQQPATQRQRRRLERRNTEQIIKARDRIKKRYAPLLSDAFQKIVNRETLAIGRQVEKLKKDRSNPDFEDWLVEFYRDFPDYIDKNTRALLFSYAEALQEVVAGEVGTEDFDFDQIDPDAREYVDGFIRQYVGASRGQLLGLSQEQDLDAVQSRLDEWTEKRAGKETDETTTGVMGMVARSVILGAGFKLAWRNRGGETCPLCKQLEGRIVARKSQPFTDENEEFTDSEGTKRTFRRTLYPGLHRGCRCVVVAE